MNKIKSLDEVDLRILPAKVVMLLSQFAYYIKRNDNIIIKLSSATVLKDVHNAYERVDDPVLDDLYNKIILEIDTHSTKSKQKFGLKPPVNKEVNRHNDVY